ncbi:Gfo/Idh/MocA family protein [Microbacterium sp. ZW T5_45]|uniref:Gfo/Idh/MocA family protein n=1 Tax=Microbacterium sp. ZW T5_45 TaxID=3378080 RepID=UPI003852B685
MSQTLRIGVLGAAKITRSALLRPAEAVPGVTVAAVAARDPDRAADYARRHRIPRVFDTYDQLLASDDVDAVYVPLPPSLHGAWTIAAIRAGKHVLVEKPFTANGDEAQAVADKAAASDVIVMEAFHALYHPLAARLRQIVADGTLGRIRSATAEFCAPIPPGKDIRWNESLGGGALMDLGCYPLRMLQSILGGPAEVLSAQATARGGIDRTMRATYRLPLAPRAEIFASLWSWRLFSSKLVLVGERASARVSWPYQPQAGAVIRISPAGGAASGSTVVERVDRTPSYTHQLRAFTDAIRSGTAPASPLSESVAMMRTIDATYAASGLSPRTAG